MGGGGVGLGFWGFGVCLYCLGFFSSVVFK